MHWASWKGNERSSQKLTNVGNICNSGLEQELKAELISKCFIKMSSDKCKVSRERDERCLACLI